MKNLIKFLGAALVVTLIFSACKKEISKISYLGGTPPVLSTNLTGTVPLSFATKDDAAFKISWTNPDYQFSTGLSSQNVNYHIEIDTAGANFTSANKVVISPTPSTDMFKAFTQGEFNDFLTSQLRLKTTQAYSLEIRVTSFLSTGAASLTSNVIKLSAAPFATPPKIAPPASGELFIVGDATAGGWNNNASPAPAGIGDQKFTQVTPTDYEITMNINGGKEFKFIEVLGSYDKQWSVKDEQPVGDPATLGTDFVFNGGNCRAPNESGTYKIVVDFQIGKYSLTKQ